MCTGDNLDTAKAISVQAGIIDSNEKIKRYTCMTGKEFREEVGELKWIYVDDEENLVNDPHQAFSD